MSDNPSLRTMCKSFTFSVDSFAAMKAESFAVANELLPWLVELRSLYVVDGFELKLTWQCIHDCLQHLLKVDSITLQGREDGVTLKDVHDHLGVPTLRNLTLEYVTPLGGERQEKSPTFQLPEGSKRTAGFTTLRLRDLIESSESLHAFVMWATALQHFDYETMTSEARTWDLTVYDSILATQLASLKSLALRFGSARMPASSMIDMSKFPNVEELTLSAHFLTYTPEVAAHKLATSRLRWFTIDFHVAGRYNYLWRVFEQPHADWLLKFASCETVQKSPLREIELGFPTRPPIGRNGPRYGPDTRYPWDVMEELKKALQDLGIRLIYDEPYGSKESYMRFLTIGFGRENQLTWAVDSTRRVTNARYLFMSCPSE